MTSTSPIHLRYLVDAVQQDRQRELEQGRLAKVANQSPRQAYAPLMFGLSRGLIAVGTRLQRRYEPEQQPSRA